MQRATEPSVLASQGSYVSTSPAGRATTRWFDTGSPSEAFDYGPAAARRREQIYGMERIRSVLEGLEPDPCGAACARVPSLTASDSAGSMRRVARLAALDAGPEPSVPYVKAISSVMRVWTQALRNWAAVVGLDSIATVVSMVCYGASVGCFKAQRAPCACCCRQRVARGEHCIPGPWTRMTFPATSSWRGFHVGCAPKKRADEMPGAGCGCAARPGASCRIGDRIALGSAARGRGCSLPSRADRSSGSEAGRQTRGTTRAVCACVPSDPLALGPSALQDL